MDDVRTLKLYAKNRKLPLAVNLGIISDEWVKYAQNVASDLNNTSDIALAQRVGMDVKGTSVENYESLVEIYNQRYCSNLSLPPEIEKLDGVCHLRFGVLETDGVIPYHLDEPYTLRFICIVQGSHKFHFENSNTFEMKVGELWYINGSYKHSVENTSGNTRIALLGKFANNETNIKLINELL